MFLSFSECVNACQPHHQQPPPKAQKQQEEDTSVRMKQPWCPAHSVTAYHVKSSTFPLPGRSTSKQRASANSTHHYARQLNSLLSNVNVNTNANINGCGMHPLKRQLLAMWPS